MDQEQKKSKQERKKQKAKSKREALNIYIVEVIQERYGRASVPLAAWQGLCRDVGEPEGTSITQCKKQMKNVHINIVDFVKTLTPMESDGTCAAVHRFPSPRALREYTRRTHKFFPLEKAKESQVLAALLINMY